MTTRYVPADAAHDRRVQGMLAAEDTAFGLAVLSWLTTRTDLATWVALCDGRVAPRTYRYLGQLANALRRRDARVEAAGRFLDIDLLRQRVPEARAQLKPVLDAQRDAEAHGGLNRVAERIAGRLHHDTLAAARALLREGLTEEQVIADLRSRDVGNASRPRRRSKRPRRH